MEPEALQTIQISLPRADMMMIKKLASRMGWSILPHRKSGIEKALDDVKHGRVHHAESVDDMFNQILG